MNKITLLFLSLALLLTAVSCAAPEPVREEIPVTVEVTRIVTQNVEVTRIVQVQPSPYPTNTPYPTYTPQPIPTPAVIIATPTALPMPAIFLELEGVGNVITDNYDWGLCDKAVFSWTAAGRDNFIVHLYKIGADRMVGLVNEIGPGEGQALQPLAGGTYYLEIVGPAEGWTINGDCLD